MTTGTTKRHLAELRAWMKRTGTTQVALARLLDCTQGFVSHCFQGRRNFSVAHTVKLSLLTGIPVEKLLTAGPASELLKLLGRRTNSAA